MTELYTQDSGPERQITPKVEFVRYCSATLDLMAGTAPLPEGSFDRFESLPGATDDKREIDIDSPRSERRIRIPADFFRHEQCL